MKIELNEHTEEILGRICLQCGHLADLFRRAGTPIKRRAENEQAFIIHWLLNLYLEHGAAYKEIAQKQLDEMHAKVYPKEEQPANGHEEAQKAQNKTD